MCISGNSVGVQISGVKQSNGQFFGSGNVVAGNLIGTDASGTRPVSNLDLGVFVNNSPGNVIGPGNVISANGIAGVEIVAAGSQQDLVAGNNDRRRNHRRDLLGRRPAGALVQRPRAGYPRLCHAQLNGVVVLGASNNTIGVDKRIAGSAGNTIAATSRSGCYITSRDFNGNVYHGPDQ